MNYSSKCFIRALTALLVALVIIGVVFHEAPLASASDEVSSKIDLADSMLQNAFAGVLQAKSSGANVSDLMVKLDEAGGFLTEAKVLYLQGNLSGADLKADECFSTANATVEEAALLKSSALADGQTSFWHTLAFSSAASAAFVIASFLVWRRFKRVYSKKLLHMKPEVASDAED